MRGGVVGDVGGMRRAVEHPLPVVGHNMCEGEWSATWEVRDGQWVFDRPLRGLVYASWVGRKWEAMR